LKAKGNKMITIAPATRADVTASLEIYQPHITGSWTSFERDVPDEKEFWDRIRQVTLTHPWLVARSGDEVLGYAYANPHRTRWAYQWTCEVSVYVSAQTYRTGIGSQLYNVLFEILKGQNVHTALAGIALPNEQSVAFHRRMGFEEVGTYRNTGYKMDGWRDVLWLQKALLDYSMDPPEFIPYNLLDVTKQGRQFSNKKG